MDCTDEIVNRIVLSGCTVENIRIVLNDYDISKKSTDLVTADKDSRQKAIKLFIVTKKVEGCTDQTIQYYMGVLKRFFAEINYPIEELSANQIRYYLAIRSTRDKISKVSQDNELRVLKSFFKWCVGEEFIEKNPTINIKAIKQEKRIKKPFTETELEMIRRHAASLRDKAIIEVLYSTGVRVNELCSMNRQDINQDEAVVFGKGEKERVVYLNAKARLALHEYLQSRNDKEEALFVSLRGERPQRLQKGGVETMIRETGKRAGISACHPHRFRRTAGTIALNRGMPLEQVQKMLGHEDIKTTTMYARSEIENIKASHKKYVV
ncbi:MAG: tyrosine-type recombinase/integrase [bacterium]|nr:tyrosine-type recombinase/integrase [bacterium]